MQFVPDAVAFAFADVEQLALESFALRHRVSELFVCLYEIGGALQYALFELIARGEQCLFILFLLRGVARNFRQGPRLPIFTLQACHPPVDPQARTILALVPASIGCASLS